MFTCKIITALKGTAVFIGMKELNSSKLRPFRAAFTFKIELIH